MIGAHTTDTQHGSVWRRRSRYVRRVAHVRRLPPPSASVPRPKQTKRRSRPLHVPSIAGVARGAAAAEALGLGWRSVGQCRLGLLRLVVLVLKQDAGADAGAKGGGDDDQGGQGRDLPGKKGGGEWGCCSWQRW